MKLKCLLFCLLIACISRAQKVPPNFKLDPVPHEFSWVNTPAEWKIVSEETIAITGGPSSRLFVDPQGASRANSAPMALFKPDETFLFSCKITVDFTSVFDAGVLMVYSDSSQWAKLCFEYTPQLQPMVVTVVNNDVSDDSNHNLIQKKEVYARIAGLGNGAYAFHYSLDGKYWHMVRYFYLKPNSNCKIGFLSQSPRGQQCRSIFSEVKYNTQKLQNIRSGE